MDLRGMIAPESVALVGASEKKGFGYWTAVNLMMSEDHLRLYFVNPNRESVLGKPCYKSISDLPEVVDCVVLATPRATVNGLLRETGEKGVRNAMVYASGYSEEHSEAGVQMEKELAEIAAIYGMNVLGPNCMGLINNVARINTLGLQTAADAFERKPHVAVVAHSGALANIFMKRPGFPVAYQITVGNGTVLAVEDFLEYLVDDESTRVIALYMEGVRSSVRLMAALKKAALKRKPIVVLKVGRSKEAAASAASHTGSMAGSHRAFEAVFEKYGVMSVDSVEELLCLSQALAVLNGNYPKAQGLASCNLSGGANILSAECAEEYDVPLARLAPETLEKLTGWIPSYATASNPLDATTDMFGQTEKVVGVLKALNDDPAVGAITVTQDIAGQATEIVRGMVEAMTEARARGVDKPLFFNCITEMDRSLEIRNRLEEAGIGLLSSMPTAYRCLKCLFAFSAYRAGEHTLALPEVLLEKGARETLGESESKRVIASLGIRIPAGRRLTDASDIRFAAQEIPFPWAMKIDSPDIPHKSDLGCVRLNVPNAAAAKKAYAAILAAAKAGRPDARIEGVQAQEMAQPGLEVIVGVDNDPQLGPMVLVGLGGVFAELFRDAAILPAPLTREEALGMLGRLKAAPLFDGYRGGEKLDKTALAELISVLSGYAFANSADLAEADLNPVFVYPDGKGIMAADCLIIRNHTKHDDER